MGYAIIIFSALSDCAGGLGTPTRLISPINTLANLRQLVE